MHRYCKPTSLDILLRQSSRFSDIWAQNNQISQINQIVSAALPNHLKKHALVADLKQETLTLYVDNPVWADLVRMEEARLIKCFDEAAHSLPKINKISVKVNAYTANSGKLVKTTTKKLSAKTADLIAESASGITDPALKEALIKLARRNT